MKITIVNCSHLYAIHPLVIRQSLLLHYTQSDEVCFNLSVLSFPASMWAVTAWQVLSHWAINVSLFIYLSEMLTLPPHQFQACKINTKVKCREVSAETYSRSQFTELSGHMLSWGKSRSQFTELSGHILSSRKIYMYIYICYAQSMKLPISWNRQ